MNDKQIESSIVNIIESDDNNNTKNATNNKVYNKPYKMTLNKAINMLENTVYGRTTVNYIPVRDTILLRVVAKIEAIAVAKCNTVGDIINEADAMFAKTMTPHMRLVVAATSPQLTDTLPINSIVDIKSLGMVVYKPFVYSDINIIEFLKEFKRKHPTLLAAASHASKQNKGKTLGNMDLSMAKSLNENDNLNPNSLVELQFYVVTEFHNISGIYIEPQDIE